MWRDHYRRRVLFVGEAHSFSLARQQYAALESERDALAAERNLVVAKYEAVVAAFGDLQREVSELREVLQLLVSTSRQQADTDVAKLRRQLEAALMKVAQRDPTRPLN